MNVQEKYVALRLLVCCLLLSASGIAGTVNASSCSQSAVQSAINSASTGDTVVLPACSVAWSGTLIVNKAVTIQGQTSCTGKGQTLSCSDGTTISASGAASFSISTNGVRITGITFTGNASSDGHIVTCDTCVPTGWRIDHNSFKSSATTDRGIYAHSGTGLIDHVYCQNDGDCLSVDGGNSADTKATGDFNWSQPLSFGSANAVYMEDSNCTYSNVLDGCYDTYNGAKIVFRYNYVSGTTIGNHGLDSGGLGTRSTLSEEIYNNTMDGGGFFTWHNSRGGTTIAFNNTVTNYGNFEDLRVYRANSADGPYPYGNGNLCNSNTTTNWVDGNIDHGYPCRDQVGRGPETTPSTDWPIRDCASHNDPCSTPSPAPVYSEVLSPNYYWGNTYNGAKPTVASNFNISDSANSSMPNTVSQFLIVNNRDYYNEVSGFNGSQGVGVGTLSGRPSTCTVTTTPDGKTSGVGFWATDTSTLYRCTASNTWGTYYSPYTYPHPLQNATNQPPAPPSGVKTTVR